MGGPSPSSFHLRSSLALMALAQAIPMSNGSTLSLKPGSLFKVLDNGAVSVVDPSTGTIDIVGNVPKSSMRSPTKTSKGNSVPAPGSFSIFPGIPNPVRGAAGLLQGAVGVLSGCAGGAVTVAPYSLIGSGMSVVKGLNAMCALVGLEGEVQHAKDTNAQGIFSGGVGALWGMRCSILSDAIKVTSLVQDIVMLPLRFAAGLQPLGQKANVVVDMLTDENVGLADIHREIISKNINNLTKLTLVATVGSGGLMVACFLVSAVALVLGLVMIPVLWSLLTLLVLGLFKSKRSPRSPPVLRSQPLPSPTQAPDLSLNATRSSFL